MKEINCNVNAIVEEEGDEGDSCSDKSPCGMVKKKKRAVTTALTQGVHLKKEIMNKTRNTLTSMVNKSLGTSDDQWLEVEDAVNNVQLSHHPELR